MKEILKKRFKDKEDKLKRYNLHSLKNQYIHKIEIEEDENDLATIVLYYDNTRVKINAELGSLVGCHLEVDIEID